MCADFSCSQPRAFQSFQFYVVRKYVRIHFENAIFMSFNLNGQVCGRPPPNGKKGAVGGSRWPGGSNAGFTRGFPFEQNCNGAMYFTIRTFVLQQHFMFNSLLRVGACVHAIESHINAFPKANTKMLIKHFKFEIIIIIIMAAKQ